jgi:beta-glucosidase
MTPQFPFGFGLSYTRFAWRDIQLASRVGPETLTVSFELTNCGECEGKEIVQLYVSAPVGELIREEQALKGFCKVSLAAGETAASRSSCLSLSLPAIIPGWRIGWYAGRWQIRVGAPLAIWRGVEVDCPPRYVPLRDDNSLQQLIQQPEAFARVVALIADKSQRPPAQSANG